MLKKLRPYFFIPLLSTFLPDGAYCLTTYKLNPGQSLSLVNSLKQPISASCLINAVATVNNSIKITMLKGAGLFNGTSLSQGQSLTQSVYNTQYIPISANAQASAQISNLGSYTIQAQCTLN